MKFLKRLFIFIFVCIVLGIAALVATYFYLKPQLPDVATIRDVKLQTPMQVYSQDGLLIAQFGEKRRIPLKLEEIPPELIEGIIATEDSRYYHHFGFDPVGITRAIVAAVTTGNVSQGASTITQQLARNIYLSNERKLIRKIKELFIAIHIEQLLSKDEILELYLNKIYLGYRAYGVGAAAQVYFGKEIKELTLSEIAIIVGLPKAPSTMNPIYSVDRATTRRNVVLSRMLDEGYITQAQYQQAKAEAIVSKYHSADIELNAPYVAELARAWAVTQYGEDAYTSGFKVITTVNSLLQQSANSAAIKNLLAYDQRHGYRGAEAQAWKDGSPELSTEQMLTLLKTHPTYGELLPAIVTKVNKQSANVYIKDHGEQIIEWDGMKWARRFRSDERQGAAPKNASEILTAGDVIRVRMSNDEQDNVTPGNDEDLSVQSNNFVVDNTAPTNTTRRWLLSQVPSANTAFIAMNPENGAIIALVGGFNFVHNNFNRATQALRQVGSGIKPFIYSAAIDKGLTLATLINDAPISQWDPGQGTAWRPKNSPPTYSGPTRLRVGLAQSKNVMAIRVLREVGLDNMRRYLTRFGFELDKLPRSETIALGAGSLTPLQMAQGYSVFANGGYYVEPFYIEKVSDPYGNVLFVAEPKTICRNNCTTAPLYADLNKVNSTSIESENETENPVSATEFIQASKDSPYAPQVISQQTAFLVREMLYSNIWGGGSWRDGTGWRGTGWRGQALKRHDIGGKTGTTNDSKDTWYNGYGPNVVAISWLGFDDHARTLGRSSYNANLGKEQASGTEAGAFTAQPPWVNFMKVALANTPEQEKEIPPYIRRVRIDLNSGKLTNRTDGSTMFEYFKEGTEPKEYVGKNQDNIYSLSGEEALF